MDQVHQRIAEQRAQTDASLVAERAKVDATGEWEATDALWQLDDLIERDRILADSRLLKFRVSADSAVARARSASPTQGRSIALERQAADQDKTAERQVTDSLLNDERQRADTAVETDRREQDLQRIGLQARRQETDEQLLTERHGADTSVVALNETRDALACAQDRQVRHDDVFGMVAHDLRSPLSVIVMGAESIVDTSADAPTLKAADRIIRAAARMERLLMDLLDVARIESGILRIDRRDHDVGELVTDVIQSYASVFAARGMAFTGQGPVDATIASFDYDRIVQVLSNLLGNAIKFSSRDGVIDLRVERHADHVEFALSDSGPGIEQSLLPNLFKRFQQIDSDSRRGLGLGLYICEKIVQAHGGRIWVDTQLGKGTTFRFTLPLS